MPIGVRINVQLAERKMSVGEFAERIGLIPTNVVLPKKWPAKAVRFGTLEPVCQRLECQPGDVSGVSRGSSVASAAPSSVSDPTRNVGTVNTCSITADSGRRCGRLVEPDVPLNLCTDHLLEAHEWVQREAGVTDLLPTPCIVCGSRLGVRYPSGWLCAVCEWRVGNVADPEDVARVRVDVVYYLRFRDQIKIGTSSNPRQRFAALRYDELLAFEPGDRALEQRRHAQFAQHRFAGTEWFATNEALSRHIAVLQAGVSDPWSQYALWRSQRLAMMS